MLILPLINILVNKPRQVLLVLKHKKMGLTETFSYMGIITLCSYLLSHLLLAPPFSDIMALVRSPNSPLDSAFMVHVFHSPAVPHPSL